MKRDVTASYPFCGSTQDGYSCSLPVGHEGLHIAEGVEVAAWGDGQLMEYSPVKQEEE